MQKGLADLAGPGGAAAAADALRLVDTYIKVGPGLEHVHCFALLPLQPRMLC